MKKLFYSLAVLVYLSVGCTRNEEPEIPNTPGDGNTPTEQTGVTEIGAIIPEVTRTSLGEHGNKQPASVLWSAGDQITVWSDTEPERKYFNLTGGAGTNNGEFFVDERHSQGVAGKEKYYAVYPANLSEPTTISLPNVQKYVADRNFATKLNPMAAVGTYDKAADKTNLTFSSLCGILVVQTYKTDATADEKITNIDVQVQSGNIWGTSEVDFSGEKPVAGDFTGGSRTMSLDCSANTSNISNDKNAPNTYYIVMPAGTYRFLRLTFYIESKENEVRSVVRSSSVTINAGEITYVGANVNVLPAKPEITPAVKYKVGDLYPDAANPEGVVFYAQNDTVGKIVALKNCGGKTITYQYGPSKVLALTEKNNGLINMEKVESAGVIADYPAFKACQEYGDGWYLPAVNELSEINEQWNAINDVLVGRSDSEELDGVYWSSTNTGRNNSISYLDADGTILTVPQNSQNTVQGHVRAIKAFESKTLIDGQPAN